MYITRVWNCNNKLEEVKISITLSIQEARILEAIALHYSAKDDEQDLLATVLWTELRGVTA